MMSLPEQGAKVASGVVDAMKNQPMVLALLIVNIIVFAVITYSVRDQRHDTQEIIKVLLERCAK